MTFSDLYKWAIGELRNGVIQADMMFKSRGINPALPPTDSAKVCINIVISLHKWAIGELQNGFIQADMMFKSRGINPALPPTDSAKVFY